MEFIRLFGEMSPFELSHLSEALFNKFEHLLIEEKQCKCDMPFTLQDVEYVMTHAMRDVQLELAQTMMDEAKMQMEKARSLTFAPRKVTKEDEARTANLSLHNTANIAGEGRKRQSA
jgi:hypothetical protein